jgi:hypothetical protein
MKDVASWAMVKPFGAETTLKETEKVALAKRLRRLNKTCPVRIIPRHLVGTCGPVWFAESAR